MSKNIFPNTLTTAADQEQNVSAESQRGKKRAVPAAPESQVKKLTTEQNSAKFIGQPKFHTATEIAANTRANVQMMPEISDEELLEMAIKFEKEHPQ